MANQLNKQINLELYSSHLYLQMSSWCAHKSLDGCARFMSQHAEEEAGHMHRLIAYMHETGALAIVGAMKAPPTHFDSLMVMFKEIYEHEKFITSQINELVHIATTEPDYSSLQFLQWYVAEQHQEEFLFQSILDRIELIGTEGQGIFFIDREVGDMAIEKPTETTSMTVE